VSAGEVTTRPRLGTLVLNAGFYRPALLDQDVAAAHELTDGRFELGMGAGWAAFEAAERAYAKPVGTSRSVAPLKELTDWIPLCRRGPCTSGPVGAW
jgi:alkanesulfonate monooxygenase SsuD/methylene tetrahydromethanopterin reductase-like flavin-dependent oxidoreductase (luciferase family)